MIATRAPTIGHLAPWAGLMSLSRSTIQGVQLEWRKRYKATQDIK